MDTSGPHIATAVFCERVLHEQDGVLSLIRIVDRLNVRAEGPEPPKDMPPTMVQITAAITLKSGSARGRHKVTIRPEDPSGRQLDAHELNALCEGEERGPNFALNLNFVAEREGLYWFDVFFDDTPMTRIPLRVIYEPTRVPG
jgi:hypothetical protein